MKQKKAGRRVAPSRRAAKVAQHPVPQAGAAPHEQRPRIGLEASVERVVPHAWTVQAVNARYPAVLSTPAMIGMMEHATAIAVEPDLPPGAITVGTRIEVDHLKAVPDGATIRASAKLVKHEGRFLVFDVEARSGQHVIGRGRVFRAIVEPDLHGAKARSRVQQ
ncbi:MAG TPA: hotdog domain-containing protein [Candidatus Polarisedimenticolia bacterium]|nr:hotdog domain-containing protein [Candidatus Polarisedimenticolia bacterium]